MEIVGLSGFARSGKDEAAKVLVEEFGYRRIAFADKLREMLYQLNPIVQADFGFEFESKWNCPEFILLQEVIDIYGWDGYKSSVFGSEIRRLLQRLGTEAGRHTLWDSIWIDATFASVGEDEKIVIPDARFFNEFDAILQRRGSVWRIERTGVGPLNDHASELEAIDYPDFEYTLFNDGTLDEWYAQIRQHAERGIF